MIKRKTFSEQIERLGGDPYYLSGEDLYNFTKRGYNKITEYKDLFKQE